MTTTDDDDDLHQSTYIEHEHEIDKTTEMSLNTRKTSRRRSKTTKVTTEMPGVEASSSTDNSIISSTQVQTTTDAIQFTYEGDYETIEKHKVIQFLTLF